MFIITSSSAFVRYAARDIPSTLLHSWDRVDPYRRTRSPNSGEGYKMTIPMSQGLPGENPDIAGDFGLFSDMHADHDAELADGEWDYGDPDAPFSGQPVSEGNSQYGMGHADMPGASDSSPLSPNRRIWEREPDKGATEELLRRRRSS
jgi:hypothetical protein